MPEEKRDWSYSVPDDGRVFPEHLIDAVWSFLQWSGFPRGFLLKPSSKEQLANLVHPAFQASLCSEEGRQVRLRVAFNPTPKRFTMQFAESRPYSASQLIKLAPTIGIGSRWLVAAPDTDSENLVRIEGILDPDILPVNRTLQRASNGLLFFQEEVQALKIAVLGPGWIRASTLHEQFELRNCCFREPLVVGRIKYVSDWFCEIPSRLAIEPAGMAQALGAALARRFFVNVLAKMSEARHGGCLLILPEGADITSLPLKTKYLTNSDKVQVAIKERTLIAPTESPVIMSGAIDKDRYADIVRADPTLSEALLIDRDLVQLTDCIAALAAVDGAVLLGRDLKLLGFGAEISTAHNPSTDEKVEYGTHPLPLGKPAPTSLADFGMRHRSAFRFCQEVPGTLAFVVSQDGGIRLFHSVDGSVQQWVELSAEQW